MVVSGFWVEFLHLVRSLWLSFFLFLRWKIFRFFRVFRFVGIFLCFYCVCHYDFQCAVSQCSCMLTFFKLRQFANSCGPDVWWKFFRKKIINSSCMAIYGQNFNIAITLLFIAVVLQNFDRMCSSLRRNFFFLTHDNFARHLHHVKVHYILHENEFCICISNFPFMMAIYQLWVQTLLGYVKMTPIN